MEGIFDFSELQREQGEWQDRNFPNKGKHECFYGEIEEFSELLIPLMMIKYGDLAHALLKMDQGIRGTKEEHMAAAKDAVGDIVIYLAGLCNQRGIDLQDAVEGAWAEVSKRDWRKYPLNGVSE